MKAGYADWFLIKNKGQLFTTDNSGCRGVVPGSDGTSTKYLSADGTFSTPSGGGGGSGDDITVNGTAATNANLDDANPAAPSANDLNVKWQIGTTTDPDDISAYIEVDSIDHSRLDATSLTTGDDHTQYSLADGTGTPFTNTGLHILDTDASHDLIIAPGSDLAADRTFTLTTGDADRTLTINGNTILGGGTHSGTNTGDQTITLTGDVTGSGTGSFDTTLSTDIVDETHLAHWATNTVWANATAGTAAPTQVTVGTNSVLGRVAGNIVAAQLVTAQIADLNVTTAKINSGAVTAGKIGSSAVTEVKINAAAVTEAKIGTGAVTTTKIGSQAVTAAKIANDTITATQIAANAVGNSELAADAVDLAEIADRTATKRLLGSGDGDVDVVEVQVGSGLDVASNVMSVKAGESNVNDSAVTTAKIADDNVTVDKVEEQLKHMMLHRTRNSGTTGKVENSTTHTDLLNYTVTGGTLGANGQLYVRMHGIAHNSNAGTRSITVRAYFGGTRFFEDGIVIANDSIERPWIWEAWIDNLNSASANMAHGKFHLASATTQTFGVGDLTDTAENTHYFGDPSDMAINTASNAAVRMTMQMNVANTGFYFQLKSGNIEAWEAA